MKEVAVADVEKVTAYVLLYDFDGILSHIEVFHPLGVYLCERVGKFHSFVNSCPIFPAPFIEETIFFPLDVFSCLVKDELPTEPRVHFWGLYSAPLVYVSVFVLVPCCLCDHSFVA